jgi:DNA-directed RNA polymerase subunit RPC12/RpoP
MIDKDLLNNLTVEQKQALLEQLMANLTELSSESSQEKPKEKKQDVPVKTVNEDFSVSVSNNDMKRRTPVRARKNQWADNEDLLRDIETPETKRTPRNRKKHSKKTVECHVCGKEFQLNANLVFGEYHRCNRCGGK